MKHHYPVRALSLLCALAIFVSLIPAALAAAPTAEQLENHDRSKHCYARRHPDQPV
ncbi:MAG: hypothetical protein V8T01_05520 [Oscillospiraceae bacterium]